MKGGLGGSLWGEWYLAKLMPITPAGLLEGPSKGGRGKGQWINLCVPPVMRPVRPRQRCGAGPCEGQSAFVVTSKFPVGGILVVTLKEKMHS